MTIKTVSFDDTQWRLVPIEPTPEMCRALFLQLVHADDEARVIKAVLAAAPAHIGDANKMLSIAPAEQTAGAVEVCDWKPEYMSDDSIAHASSCGDLWSFVDGGPEANGVRFCQGCGKPINLLPMDSEDGAEHD